ncbi:hypothetical protein ACUN24_20990 [Pedobacter sp. WC2501]|uniref:hypothetical protein n=1 Tax=Pedobacter sp. WC2501 TaxID=3461400 RepID=UPI004045FAD1
METTGDRQQPKKEKGEQKVLLDPAITAETDELDPRFQQDQTINDKPAEVVDNIPIKVEHGTV